MPKSPTILMYHAITSPQAVTPESRETGAELYDVTIENFRSQMRWLKDNGYRTCSAPGSRYDHLPPGSRSDHLPPGSGEVIITFDDGEMNNFTEALPVLKEHGFTAAFFIIVGRTERHGYMGWKEIKGLVDAGMTVGSHGLSHTILTNLPDTLIEQELKASKATMEINLNTTIDTLSIPRGFCNDKVLRMAYGLGYKTIYISDRPRDLTEPCHNRVAVKGSWSLDRFALAVTGRTPIGEKFTDILKRGAKRLLHESGYNWLRGVVIRIVK